MTSGRGCAGGPTWPTKKPRRSRPRWPPSPRLPCRKQKKWRPTPGAAYGVPGSRFGRARPRGRAGDPHQQAPNVSSPRPVPACRGHPRRGGQAVSLHDPDARPIKKGRIGKPVEFGYLAQVVDNEDGVVVDHSPHIGNPADGPARPGAREGESPRRPGTEGCDRRPGLRRGQGRPQLDRPGCQVRSNSTERPPGARPSGRRTSPPVPRPRQVADRLQRQYSALKRSWGWSRSFMDGLAATEVWCGYGVFANNSQKISGLIAEEGPGRGRATARRPPGRPANGPPPRPQPPPALPIPA